jgi:hypothetical protein
MEILKKDLILALLNLNFLFGYIYSQQKKEWHQSMLSSMQPCVKEQ